MDVTKPRSKIRLKHVYPRSSKWYENESVDLNKGPDQHPDVIVLIWYEASWGWGQHPTDHTQLTFIHKVVIQRLLWLHQVGSTWFFLDSRRCSNLLQSYKAFKTSNLSGREVFIQDIYAINKNLLMLCVISRELF